MFLVWVFVFGEGVAFWGLRVSVVLGLKKKRATDADADADADANGRVRVPVLVRIRELAGARSPLPRS